MTEPTETEPTVTANSKQVVVSRRFIRFWVMVPFLIVAITLGSVWVDIQHNRKARKVATATADLRLCSEIEKLKKQIRATVHRSDLLLPTLSYYKTHPDDLRTAHQENERVLAAFARTNCRTLPTVPSK